MNTQAQRIALLCSLLVACGDDGPAGDSDTDAGSGTSDPSTTTPTSTTTSTTTTTPGDDTTGTSAGPDDTTGVRDGTTEDGATETTMSDDGESTSGTTDGESSSDTSDGASSSSSDGAGPVCGDAMVEGDEVCDGSDLAGQSCATLGMGVGQLACAPDCSTFDTSGCGPQTAEVCNGVDDDGDGLVDEEGGCKEHLLISEIVMAPYNAELIEIFNPTNAAVDLTNVYLSDNHDYWQVPSGEPFLSDAPADSTDFVVHFPAGSSIAAGEWITVAINVFNTSPITDDTVPFPDHYGGVCPSYHIAHNNVDTSACPSSVAMINHEWPTLGNYNASLRNAGELVVLFQWDGESDLVQDLDYVNWGEELPPTAYLRVNKTGQTMDGPDLDALPSAYLPDTAPALQGSISSAQFVLGTAAIRCYFDEGTEVAIGGNGIGGDDETSEPVQDTFAIGPAPMGAIVFATPGAPNDCP